MNYHQHIINFLFILLIIFIPLNIYAQLPFFNELSDNTTHEWDEDEIKGDPHKASHTWLQKRPEIQQARDKTMRALSKGAVFVPAMTTPNAEPKYTIYNDKNEFLTDAPTGTTTYLFPGDYIVYVGSGPIESQLSFDAHVIENEITFIPAEWSALVVKVVNSKGIAFRGNYELLTLPQRDYIGFGVGAALAEGEELSTWLLWPGKIMVISAGEDYRAKKNFLTVNLQPGHLTYLTLVLDEETGDILGGGEIDDQLLKIETKNWNFNLITGGAFSFNHTRNLISKVNDETFDISAFVQALLTILIKNHYIYTRFNAEIGGNISLQDKFFVTSTDDLNLEFLYTYKLTSWFGPYFRTSFESNMAPSTQKLDKPHNIQKLNARNEIIHQTSEPTVELKLAPPFSYFIFNAGTGAKFDASIGNWFNLNSRVGFAYRTLLTRGLYILRSIDPVTQLVTLTKASNSHQFGLEVAVYLELIPVSWLSIKMDATLLEPFNDYKAPLFELKSSATIRLSNIASLAYILKLNYEKRITDKIQIDQLLQLRFSYKFF